MNTQPIETGSHRPRRSSAALPDRARLANSPGIFVRKADMASMVTIDCGSCVNDRLRRDDNGSGRMQRCLHAATLRGDHCRTCAPLLSRVTT